MNIHVTTVLPLAVLAEHVLVGDAWGTSSMTTP